MNIKFEYVNWKGNLHTYVIEPKDLTLDEETGLWMLNGTLVKRDLDPRPRIQDRSRSFVLTQIKNLSEG